MIPTATATSKQRAKPTTRIAFDSQDIELIIYCLESIVTTTEMEHKKELLKKLQLAKFKVDNEITVAYTKTGRAPTNAQQLIEAFDEEEFLKEIEAIEAAKQQQQQK